MRKRHRIRGIVLAAITFAFALPAAAGSLSPRLQTLADSWRQAPVATLARLTAASGVQTQIFAPRVSATGRVEVYIRFRPGEMPAAGALATLGAENVVFSPALGIVQAWVPIGRLRETSQLAGVVRVDLPAYGRAKVATLPDAMPRAGGVPPGLRIDREGISGLDVQPLVNAGMDGSGLRVGVISVGVDGLSESQNAGYLPNNVWVAPGLAGEGAEGTAMLEEVHAMAPGAALGFCGPTTTVDFVTCLDDLDNEFNADVIVDDLGFFAAFLFNQPDGDALVNAVGDFIAAHPQINLATAAGNDALDYFQHAYLADTHPNRISLHPDYTPGPGQAGGRSYQSAMNFGAAVHQHSDATEPTLIAPTSLDPAIALNAFLTWNDPAGGPYDDVDLFLVKANGTVVASSTYDQTQGPDPGIGDGEYIYYQNKTGSNQTLYLAALCFQCAHPILIKLNGFLDGAGTFQYATKGGIFGRAGLAGELAVGAAQVVGGPPAIADMEPFSDSGPYTYGDWQSGIQTRPKPDLVGIDGVTVSGAGGFPSPFYGTSAAAPNVASVIALLRGAFPDGASNAAGWAQIVDSNANPDALNKSDPDIIGAGLADAGAAAISLDGGPMMPAITAPSGSPPQVAPNTAVTFAGICGYDGIRSLDYDWFFGTSEIPNSHKRDPDPVEYAYGGVYTVQFFCSDDLQRAEADLVLDVEAPATAEDLSFSVVQNQRFTGQLKGSGLGGGSLIYEATTLPGHGTLTIHGPGPGYDYIPDEDYVGDDSFQYDIDNGVMKSNVATVSISVKAAPPPPPPPPPPPTGGGGGGSLGAAVLGLLAGLALLLRRRRWTRMRIK